VTRRAAILFNCVLLSLSYQYLGLYENIAKTISSVFAEEIVYNKETISALLVSYGKNIVEFKELFEKYIEKDLRPISEILWNKEPSPLTVLDYYKDLKDKDEQLSLGGPITPVTEAEKLFLILECPK
jgi:hypothetical protein